MIKHISRTMGPDMNKGGVIAAMIEYAFKGSP